MNAPRSWPACIVGMLVFLLSAGVVPIARADVTFDLPIQDSTLTIVGTIENRPIDLTRTVRVRLRGATENQSLLIKSSANPLDFVGAEKGAGDKPPAAIVASIPAANITIEEKPVQGGQAVDLVVTVKGVGTPGIFRGPVDFSLASQPTVTTRWQLELRVGVKPVIEVTDKSVGFSVSNCTGRCWFTEWIAPGTTNSDSSVTVVNRSPIAIGITVESDLKGATGPAAKSLASSGKTIEPGHSAQLTLSLARKKLTPDHYTGTLVLIAKPDGLAASAATQPDGSVVLSNATIATVPATVDVRSAALLPFLIVLAGVVGGRLYKLLSTPSREARLALFPQYLLLRDRIGTLNDAAARHHCTDLLENIWGRALSGDATDAKLRQEFTNLGATVDLYAQIEKLAADAHALGLSDVEQNAIKGALATASQAVRTSTLEAAAAAVKKARDLLDAAVASHAAGGSGLVAIDPGAANAFSALANKLATSASTQFNIQKKQASRWRTVASSILWFVSGIDTTETIALQTWFLRPLVFLALVLVLAFYGLSLLYAGPEHSTFGAKGFTEYLGLFLWGFGAQVVTLSFQDIQFGHKP